MANDSCILLSSAVLHSAASRTHTRALRFRPPRSPACTLRSVAARRRSRCAHRRRFATSTAAPLAAAADVAAIAAARPRFQAAASVSRFQVPAGYRRQCAELKRTRGCDLSRHAGYPPTHQSCRSAPGAQHHDETLAFFLPFGTRTSSSAITGTLARLRRRLQASWAI